MMPLMGSLDRILLGNPLGGSYTGGVKSMWEQGTVSLGTGTEVTSDISVRSEYIPCRENAYYTQRSIGWGTFENINWYFYDSEKNFLKSHRDTTFTALELAPVNCAFLRMVIVNAAENPITPSDVPNITVEDRSVWGWKDMTESGNIRSTKRVSLIENHYYYQRNDLKLPVVFNPPLLSISNQGVVKSSADYDSELVVNGFNVPGNDPTKIGDVIIEDRDVWGWLNDGNAIRSEIRQSEKRILLVQYDGDLTRPHIFVDVSEGERYNNVPYSGEIGSGVNYYLYISKADNPNITPADMVNHGTWTVTFSDPVSEVWQSDGSVYYTPHNSEIQKGKILAITPPSTFKAVSLVVQDSTGQNSHDITGGAEVTLSDSTEWVYLTVGIAENPDVNLTNIDSFREQWSYSYKDIPVPVEPHWDGENFVFSVSDIQVGKAWQKSGDDIIIVDDAGSVALPMIPNPSARWRIILNNNLGVTMSGMQLRKTSAGVSVQESYIYSGSSLSIILGEENAQVAFYGANSIGASAEDIYRGITITGSEG